MNDYLNLIKYSVKSPFISFVDISSRARQRIFDESLKVWEIILPKSEGGSLGMRYFPVLTIFAKQEGIEMLKVIEGEGDCRIDPDARPMLERLLVCLDIIHNKEIKCKEILDILIKIRNEIEEDDEIELKYKFECFLNLINDINAFHNIDLHKIILDWLKDNEYEIIDLKERRDLRDLNLKKFVIRILESLSNHPKKEKEFQVFLIRLLINSLIIIGFIFDVSGEPDEGGIQTIYKEIRKRYGCFLGPKFWKKLEKSGLYPHVLEALGLPRDVHLFQQPCVFIYPFMIDERYQNIVREEGYDEDLLWELFCLTLIHEHGHACIRHGLMKTGEKTTIKKLIKQVKLDQIRKKTPYIEEGLAVEFEWFYALSGNMGSPLKNKLIAIIDKYVNSKPIKIWPYSGKKLIDALINEKLNPGKTKLSDKEYFEKGLGKLYDIINDWKYYPEKLQKQVKIKMGKKPKRSPLR